MKEKMSGELKTFYDRYVKDFFRVRQFFTVDDKKYSDKWEAIELKNSGVKEGACIARALTKGTVQINIWHYPGEKNSGKLYKVYDAMLKKMPRSVIVLFEEETVKCSPAQARKELKERQRNLIDDMDVHDLVRYNGKVHRITDRTNKRLRLLQGKRRKITKLDGEWLDPSESLTVENYEY